MAKLDELYVELVDALNDGHVLHEFPPRFRDWLEEAQRIVLQACDVTVLAKEEGSGSCERVVTVPGHVEHVDISVSVTCDDEPDR